MRGAQLCTPAVDFQSERSMHGKRKYLTSSVEYSCCNDVRITGSFSIKSAESPNGVDTLVTDAATANSSGSNT